MFPLEAWHVSWREWAAWTTLEIELSLWNGTKFSVSRRLTPRHGVRRLLSLLNPQLESETDEQLTHVELDYLQRDFGYPFLVRRRAGLACPPGY